MSDRTLLLRLCFIAFILLLLSLPGCGGKGDKGSITQPGTVAADPSQPASPVAEHRSVPEAMTVYQAVAQIESAPVPGGVDPALWGELTAELARVVAQGGSSQIVQHPPIGDRNQVDDLELVDDGSSQRLEWTYVNVGDYDQNGEVGVSDLTPIGLYFNKGIDDPLWSAARLADGNGDGLITVSDITPIGQNFLSWVAGYNAYGRSGDTEPWYLLATADLVESTGTPRKFSVPVESAEYSEHWVLPVTEVKEHTPVPLIEEEVHDRIDGVLINLEEGGVVSSNGVTAVFPPGCGTGTIHFWATLYSNEQHERVLRLDPSPYDFSLPIHIEYSTSIDLPTGATVEIGHWVDSAADWQSGLDSKGMRIPAYINEGSKIAFINDHFSTYTMLTNDTASGWLDEWLDHDVVPVIGSDHWGDDGALDTYFVPFDYYWREEFDYYRGPESLHLDGVSGATPGGSYWISQNSPLGAVGLRDTDRRADLYYRILWDAVVAPNLDIAETEKQEIRKLVGSLKKELIAALDLDEVTFDSIAQAEEELEIDVNDPVINGVIKAVGFATGEPTGEELRNRLQQAVDHFDELQNLPSYGPGMKRALNHLSFLLSALQYAENFHEWNQWHSDLNIELECIRALDIAMAQERLEQLDALLEGNVMNEDVAFTEALARLRTDLTAEWTSESLLIQTMLWSKDEEKLFKDVHWFIDGVKDAIMLHKSVRDLYVSRGMLMSCKAWTTVGHLGILLWELETLYFLYTEDVLGVYDAVQDATLTSTVIKYVFESIEDVPETPGLARPLGHRQLMKTYLGYRFYRRYWSAMDGNRWVPSLGLGLRATIEWVFGDVLAVTYETLRVKTITDRGNALLSRYACLIGDLAYRVPPTLLAPVHVGASIGEHTHYIEVTWEHPEGGPVPDGYEVHRSSFEGGPFEFRDLCLYPAQYWRDQSVPDHSNWWYQVLSYKSGYAASEPSEVAMGRLASEQPTYTASGYVETAGGSGIGGVTVTVKKGTDVRGTSVTPSSGYWSVSGLEDGLYNAYASKTGWSFDPYPRSFTVAGENEPVSSIVGEEASGDQSPEAVLVVAGGDVTGYAPETIVFDASASHDPDDGTSDGAGIVKWEWDWDGEAGGIYTYHEYAENDVKPWNYITPGYYEPTVRVTDNEGQTDTAYVVVDLLTNHLPIARINTNPAPPEVFTGDTITFDCSASSDEDGHDLIAYEWDFNLGDGEQLVDYYPQTSVQHSYDTAGTYTVLLRVEDEEEGSDREQIEVEVYDPGEPPVIASINPDYGYTGQVLTFYPEYTGTPDFDFSWTFGGACTSGSSTQERPQMTLTTPGTYTVSLTMTNDAGEDSDSISFEVMSGSGEWKAESFSAGCALNGPRTSIRLDFYSDGTPVVSNVTLSGLRLTERSDNPYTGSPWVHQVISNPTGIANTVAVDSADTVWLAYANPYGYDLEVKWNDGDGWDVTGFSVSGEPEFLSMELDDDAYPWIAYYDDSPEDLKYVRYNGSSWSGPTTIDSSGNIGEYATLACSADGTPGIAYCDVPNARLKYARWSGSSFTTETAVQSAGSPFRYSSLAFAGDGNPAIAYSLGMYLYFVKWNGSSWQGAEPEIRSESPYSIDELNLAYDPDGKPCIVYWVDGEPPSLMLARNDGGWGFSQIGAGGEFTDVMSCTVQFDQNDIPWISYHTAYSSGTYWIRHWYGTWPP